MITDIFNTNLECNKFAVVKTYITPPSTNIFEFTISEKCLEWFKDMKIDYSLSVEIEKKNQENPKLLCWSTTNWSIPFLVLNFDNQSDEILFKLTWM